MPVTLEHLFSKNWPTKIVVLDWVLPNPCFQEILGEHKSFTVLGSLKTFVGSE